MKDDELHYAGPYDRLGKPLELITWSDSSMGHRELRENFYGVRECDQTIHDNFMWDYSLYGDGSNMDIRINFIPLSELARLVGNAGVRKGFISIDAIDAIEQNPDIEPEYIVEEVLSPFGYAALPPEEQKKYSFYMWKEYDNVENFASQLMMMAENLAEGIVYGEGEFKMEDVVVFYPSPY